MVLDSRLERDIGLGRDFSKQLIGEGEVLVTRASLVYLGLNPDEHTKTTIRLDLREILTVLSPLVTLIGGKISAADLKAFLEGVGADLTDVLSVDMQAQLTGSGTVDYLNGEGVDTSFTPTLYSVDFTLQQIMDDYIAN